MDGFAGMEPFVTVMKFVMVMKLFDGIVNAEQNTGVWVKDVTFVPPDETVAGLIATPPMAQSTALAAVQVLVTLAAPF